MWRYLNIKVLIVYWIIVPGINNSKHLFVLYIAVLFLVPCTCTAHSVALWTRAQCLENRLLLCSFAALKKSSSRGILMLWQQERVICFPRENKVNLLNIRKFKPLGFTFEVFFMCSCLKFRIILDPVLLSTLPKSAQLALAVDPDQNFWGLGWYGRFPILSLSFNFWWATLLLNINHFLQFCVFNSAEADSWETTFKT